MNHKVLDEISRLALCMRSRETRNWQSSSFEQTQSRVVKNNDDIDDKDQIDSNLEDERDVDELMLEDQKYAFSTIDRTQLDENTQKEMNYDSELYK